MAMNGSQMGDEIKAAIASVTFVQGQSVDAFRTAVFEAMGNAIVNHIKTHATISGLPVTVTSVTAVTVGLGISGPGTGTASGTGNIS